jgi:ferredoxin-NADP reductase
MGEVPAEARQEIAELRSEVARLKARLDAAGRRNTLLCPASAMMDAMEASLGEADGTILRATDDPELEFELEAGSWVRRR